MDLLHSLTGMIEVTLTCADTAYALDEMRKMNLRLYRISLDNELCIRFLIARKDVHLLKAYSAKRGMELSESGRVGIFWPLKAFLSRKILVFSLLILFAFSFWMPTRILFIRVEGNETVSSARILEAAEQSGVYFGASRRNVRSEKVKNRLLAEIPQLQWVGVNTNGTQAVITVLERPEMTEQKEFPSVSSVVALRDGLIISATVTRGTPLCAPGQPVKEGQVLISGYTDLGLSIGATRAEGEILAQTMRSLEIKTPQNLLVRDDNGTVTKNYSLLIGKKRINFFKGSGISDTSCVKMYSKYVLTLPGGFRLPVAWICETYTSAAVTEGTVNRQAAEIQLKTFASQYLKETMIAGSVLEQQETAMASKGNYCLSGRYVCREIIGRDREELIGEYHGKDNGTDRERGSGG